MVILHIANLDDKKSVGPNINVPKNVIYGNKYANVGLYNLFETSPPIKVPDNKYFSKKEYKRIKDLPKPFNKPDLVVFQGLFYIEYCKISQYLIEKNIPYIIVPRCSMTSAGLKNTLFKYIKKKIACYLIFNKFIINAKSIQFLTQNEYMESKDNFKIKDYFIMGNGVEEPSTLYKQKNRQEFKIVFIARYNVYHKGLDVLLKSIKNNYKWFNNNNVTINLYGSNSDNGYEYLSHFVNENNLNNVKINGPVYDKDKEKVLLDSDVFIHTSRLEGQPTAVIEAISYGIPVIVTPGTNLYDVVSINGLGFVCDFDEYSIFSAIKKSYENKNKFQNISNKEIEFSQQNFEWDTILKKTIVCYNKLIR